MTLRSAALVLFFIGALQCRDKSQAERMADQWPRPEVEASGDSERTAKTADPASRTLPEWFKILSPQVVNLYSTHAVADNPMDKLPSDVPGEPVAPEEMGQHALGSGLIIDDVGNILTNAHVVQEATDVHVRFLSGEIVAAEVVGTDPYSDLALVRAMQRLRQPPAPAVWHAKGSLEVGESVFAIGNPFGLDHTMTAGIVSAVGRTTIFNGPLQYGDFIQTDCAINPGNSGGPLYNLRGEVVGINTAIKTRGHGIGFAIPAHVVTEVLPRLRRGRERQQTWIGMRVQALPKEAAWAEIHGVFVTEVTRGGPAAVAGIQPGDGLTHFNGQPVTSGQRLKWLVSNAPVGTPVPVGLHRNGVALETVLTPLTPPAELRSQ